MKTRWILSGLLILLLVLAAVTLTACGGASSLVGKWEYAEEEVYMEFFNDGQMEMGDGYTTMICTYEETGDKEITLTLVSVNGEVMDGEEDVVLEYSISGDELTLDDGETPITVTRMK
ncbi:MAG: DUF5640 domain-containing protein [Dehalococcoidia bacterium]|jgi:ABC-type glycerol-3-phosphate transport system substrate-binding protein